MLGILWQDALSRRSANKHHRASVGRTVVILQCEVVKVNQAVFLAVVLFVLVEVEIVS